MFGGSSRRRFLQGTTSALAAFADLTFLRGLPVVSAADAQIDPKVVRFQPEIEPLVRLLEDTPRERLLEEVAARIKSGTTYREILTALLLAGVPTCNRAPWASNFTRCWS